MPDPLPRSRPSAPQVIAHRGVPRELPENTLAGFALALDQGADGIELDVHLTLDGRIVVHHDPSLAGTTGPGSGPTIRASTLEALRAASAEELPELEDVLELVRGRARLHVELKGAGVALPVARLVKHAAGGIAVHSFDHRAVRQLATVAPALATGILMVARAVDPVALLEAASARTLWQEATLMDGTLVRDVHAAGGQVIAWTVNDVELALHLAAMGVDGICTDRPAAIRAALGGAD